MSNMKKIELLCLFLLLVGFLQAQESGIENVNVRLSHKSDSMLVNYDLNTDLPVIDIQLHVFGENHQAIKLTSVTGDVGPDIKSGENKLIVWDMTADSIDIQGENVFVQISCDLLLEQLIVKEKTWIPWFYIASGASFTTGLVAHISANRTYEKYLNEKSTIKSESLNQQVRSLETVRNVAYTSAAVLGAIGVRFHIKHKQKDKALTVNYSPQPKGAALGFTLNF